MSLQATDHAKSCSFNGTKRLGMREVPSWRCDTVQNNVKDDSGNLSPHIRGHVLCSPRARYIFRRQAAVPSSAGGGKWEEKEVEVVASEKCGCVCCCAALLLCRAALGTEADAAQMRTLRTGPHCDERASNTERDGCLSIDRIGVDKKIESDKNP